MRVSLRQMVFESAVVIECELMRSRQMGTDRDGAEEPMRNASLLPRCLPSVSVTKLSARVGHPHPYSPQRASRGRDALETSLASPIAQAILTTRQSLFNRNLGLPF